jgi:hypothetical protein
VNELEQQLLREQVGINLPTLTIRSRAKIDAGRWWRKTPLWLCVVGGELVMLAVARRRYAEKIAIAECPDSHYNPSTGELVIKPGENLRFSRFKMPPGEAIQILKIINPQSISKTLQN